jgi:hypothetical protein
MNGFTGSENKMSMKCVYIIFGIALAVIIVVALVLLKVI